MPKAKGLRLKAVATCMGLPSFPSGACFYFILSLCVLLLSCARDSGKNSGSSPKFTQYYNQGEQLYAKHCSNCHQKDGAGLGRLYPPLANSDYMKANFNEVVCLMRFGTSGELIVNGISFNQKMPGVASLTDLEIAEIATYIYNSWGNDRGIIEVKEVTPILQQCAAVE